MSKLTTVGIYNEDWQAHIAVGELAEHGIEAIINNEIMSSIYPIGAMGGIKVLVMEKNAAEATEILKKLIFQ